MITDEQKMLERESLLKDKYKLDGLVVYCDGVFYCECANETDTINTCLALNEMEDRHKNDRNLKLSDVKSVIRLLFDLKKEQHSNYSDKEIEHMKSYGFTPNYGLNQTQKITIKDNGRGGSIDYKSEFSDRKKDLPKTVNAKKTKNKLNKPTKKSITKSLKKQIKSNK